MFAEQLPVRNAVIGDDGSLVGGGIGAVTLVAVNAAVNRLILLSGRAQRLPEGTPTDVIVDGRIVEESLRRLGLRRSELEQAVRLQDGGTSTRCGPNWTASRRSSAGRVPPRGDRRRGVPLPVAAG
ncbi:hypothetical protein [Modestobacter altitudinis]|uniref:hypothetical protein n=1 Tax=Modestobacter altitudinis TaxID=2213158 RepID=UPI00110D1B39|nr:hypothetical protein [Modestobacter altitudinis]